MNRLYFGYRLLYGDDEMRFLWMAIFLCSTVYAATSGQVTTSANVGQLINIQVESVAALGDIRTTDHTNFHMMTIIVDNNDDDGFTLTFQSGNGTIFSSENNFGYLLHASAYDDTSVQPNEGQRPSDRYTLVLGEHADTTEYGHTDLPVNLSENCKHSNSAVPFSILENTGHDVVFNQVDRATRTGIFEVCLTQNADPQLFHGNFSDTITVTIADN